MAGIMTTNDLSHEMELHSPQDQHNIFFVSFVRKSNGGSLYFTFTVFVLSHDVLFHQQFIWL